MRPPGQLTRCLPPRAIGAAALMLIPHAGSGAAATGGGRSAAPGSIAYKCGDWLCLTRPDGSGARRLLPPGLRYPFPQWDPAFSPGGAQVAFRGYYASGDGAYALYVAGADGCSLRRLTRGVAADPSWSPDGAWIAFDTSGGGTLWKIHPDGTALTRIETGLPGDRDSSPAWSPDGARVAFVHADRLGRGQIWVVRENGRGATRLHRATGASDATPAWSRDGRRIAFVVQTRQRTRIDVMQADGRLAHPVAEGFDDTWNPVWLPGAATIAYLSGISGSTGAIRIRGAGGPPRRTALPANPQFAWTSTALPPRHC